MKKTLVGAVFGAGTLFAVGVAQAMVLTGSYSEGSYFETWQQDSDPTTLSHLRYYYIDVPVWNVVGNVGESDDFVYYNTLDGGGFNKDYGTQLYTGPEWAPVFSVGTFTGLTGPGGTDGVITFSAGDPAVAEVSTWAMTLVGFAGLAASYVRSRRTVLVP